MAPGCYSAQDSTVSESARPDFSFKPVESYNAATYCYSLDDIPLPPTPPPVERSFATLSPVIRDSPRSPSPKSLDTVDSFEVLEQTIMKQKRLARAKKSMDMRMKVLLKRTFDLVCTIMDRENGFNDDEDQADGQVSSGLELELTPDRQNNSELCARLDLETYLAESELQLANNEEKKIEKVEQPSQYEITVQVDENYFQQSLKHEFEHDRRNKRFPVAHAKRRRLSDDDDDDNENDDDESDEDCFEVKIRRMQNKRPRRFRENFKKQRIY